MIFKLEAQRKYMLIPFMEHGRSFEGCDCGGLVWLVYKTELGIELPDWREYYKNTQIESFAEISSTIGTMFGNIGKEVERDSIKPFDVICFNIAGNPVHVGIAVNQNMFMHVMEGYSCVRQERLEGMSWRRRIDGIFRHPAVR